jgi:hypothetical protein
LIVASIFFSIVATFIVEWVDGRANWPKQVSDETGTFAVGNLRTPRSNVPPMSLFVTGAAQNVEAFSGAKRG